MYCKATTAPDDETLAAMVLALLPAPRVHERAACVREAGSCRKALSDLCPRIPPDLEQRATEECKAAGRHGYSILTLTGAEYPALLTQIPDPPLVLYVWGSFDPRDGLALAVVGSRRASPYGLCQGERLAGELAARGLTIVSGLARGIDAAAHRAALAQGGRTIAVLGSGLDTVYPREHRALAARIARSGLVVSEFPLGAPPLPGHFPQRNRIISGLSLGTLVIEATERSGSLISARHALEQDREVFALPGPVEAPGSLGVNRLIQEGAKLVSSADDVVEELRADVRELLAPESGPPPGSLHSAASSLPLDPLGADERVVLEALAARGTADADALSEAARLPVGRVNAALARLELGELVGSFPGGFFRVKSRGGSR